jgi:hypothetical protein
MSKAAMVEAVGWTISDSGTVAAVALSVLALLVSWLAYRQRARFHAQPKLVVEWGERLQPVDDGLFLRESVIVNHGDASARDLRVGVEFTADKDRPWLIVDVLEPGHRTRLSVPVVDGVSQGEGAYGTIYQRIGDPATYRFVTPRVTLRWRQAPFGGKIRKFTERAPHTPNMLDGETD